MIGISIKPTIGIGDSLQFSSLPENYFRATGKRLIDISKPWFFDHNPFVERDVKEEPEQIIELWNFSPKQFDWPNPRRNERPGVYLSNAEIWASVLGVPVSLNRPRLYKFEDVKFKDRRNILLHTQGVSHGIMPYEIVDFICEKYGPTGELFQIGAATDKPIPGLLKLDTPTLWDLAEVISQARMIIGMDSGPSWVAACYPDVVSKKIRFKPSPENFHSWVPLDMKNIHSHWDDRCHQIFNPTLEDIGFTSSYRKI